MKRIILMVGLFIGFFSVGAEKAKAVNTYVCSYFVMAHMPDDGGSFSPPKPEIERVEKFEMTFVVDGEKAYLIGNVATVPVQILHEVEGILFVERTASGTLQINAIDRYGNSVYSRHTFIDKLTPSQHYGQCNYR